MRPAAVITLICSLAASLSAQGLPIPAGWRWATDADARHVTTLDLPEGSWLFGTMAPGWHITTGPGVALFEPAYTGRGRFTIESESFLFPGTSAAGFGVFIGGRELESARRRYTAFVIRRDGSAAIERYDGGSSTPAVPWRKHAAVIADPGGKDQAKNTIRVEVEAATASFLVNGTKVAEIPRTGDELDGIVGLRVGPDLNLHVTNLDLTHRLALPRRAPSK